MLVLEILNMERKGPQEPFSLGVKWYNQLPDVGSPTRWVADRDSNSDPIAGHLKALSPF